jgi:hypothetical protein
MVLGNHTDFVVAQGNHFGVASRHPDSQHQRTNELGAFFYFLGSFSVTI